MPTRRSRSAGRTPRRQGKWYDTSLNSTLSASTQVGIDLTTEMDPEQRHGSTIVRTILDLTLQPATTGINLRCYLGLVLVELDAFAANALPDPSVNDDQPGWLYKVIRNVRTGSLDTVPNNGQIQLDLRSKRKFPGEDVLYTLVLERDSATGSVLFTGQIRTLILLP